MTEPLKGIRVIDLSHVIAGPLASFYLAQFGADVMKIEAPAGGDIWRRSRKVGESEIPPGFVSVNAGKRSVAIDIRTEEGADAIRKLAQEADVFVENFRPGVVKKYGLDYDTIKELNPNIVYCSISGYGQTGEWARRPAYDHVIQALTGMMMMGGEKNSPPTKVGFPVVDVAVGMLGAMSIMAAICEQQRTGRGQYISASMVQASMMLMYPCAVDVIASGQDYERVGNRGYSGSPTADTYQCVDGWLAISANTVPQFKSLMTVLGLEDVCQDERALDMKSFNAPVGGIVVANDLEYLRQRLHNAFAHRSASELEKQLNELSVPASRVRSLGEFLQTANTSPELIDIVSRNYDGGAELIETPGFGFKFGETTSGQVFPGAPMHGADTEDVLVSLGWSAQKIAELNAQNKIHCYEKL
ncbi:CaiB/BaiF CoA transferase family protein [Alcaligenes endophyticus]|uniref:CoA transferase n=1 Tax=Alcaligenes endophyticus TaxID=1929088 RepID=A0ABT8EJR1_9BURK|nr:CoA transferase [Alcaligenes endophyticus]MCX5592861.1 CoA transferase [Alcaligenes endophyticus]MDN4121530.1 CoA transferase [Alcaligenes endophyticus]